MLRFVTCIALLAAIVGASVMPAESRGRAKQRYWNAPPLKDCTRVNARFGYYGNPWCSPAEQDRWDRATTRTR